MTTEARPNLAGGADPDVAGVRPAARLRGRPGLPGDKSISHRALLLAALASGESAIRGAGDGADVRTTAGLIGRLGATVERGRSDGRRVDYRVVSPGIDGLHEADGVLDCGNSGTTTRLIAGILTGLPGYHVLDGDDSLRRRPLARIIAPLRAMGAEVRARRGDTLLPMSLVGHSPLKAIDHQTAVPSAQVKSAILLAGLRADGETTVRESVATRDHTERMLRARGVSVRRTELAGGGVAVSVEGGATVRAIAETVPGDPSAAAFWLVAAAIHPDAELVLEAVGVNATRRAVIDLLRRMGASIEERPVAGAPPGAAATGEAGEPLADLIVRSSALRAIDISPAEVAQAIDEIPILCLAATQATGITAIRGAGELRAKESDRIAGIAAGLTALGAKVRVDSDDISISGPTPLVGAATDSCSDHRLAMTFAIAGLIASGATTISE
ncbi:MAG TPA: 3-phosphoshikimate 1-carboxyvinyltransferase, partial [Candidatus Limnocylindrales bacterium]|nr:3-phosphoshikimate 1-carboxyvinyltransferase [Candidatus Limnocylindrales bacterium]